jgi:redox-sensing transcriptional repressor
MPANPQVPEPTVLRLSVYLGVLSRLEAEETDRASSATIGVRAGVRPEQVRKDLSYFGEFGRPGLGYSVPELRRHLARILRADRELRVVLLGVGRLGSALLGYPGFAERGFQVVGAFDSDPEKVGVRIGPHVVMDVQHLRFVVAELGAEIGILARPAEAAQQGADLMVEAGLRAILNFAATSVSVPPGVAARHLDMTRELEVLAYHLPE